jgi:hypothetical protein
MNKADLFLLAWLAATAAIGFGIMYLLTAPK